METLLIFKDATSHKFWKIHIAGNTFTVTYGKVGTIGSVKSKEFESEEICKNEGEKRIQSKIKKGYVVTQLSDQVVKDSSMTEDLFWGLLDRCKEKGNDADEQVEWLVAQLSRKPVKDIIMFESIFKQYYYKLHTSNLWAAAYIVMGGCSDDCFDYFRAWVLYLGKDPYEAAIQNPETLLPYFILLKEQEEIPQLEELLSAACMAYEEKTGLDDDRYDKLYHQLAKDDYTEPEIEFDWNEDDEEGLRQKFPLLWEAFGENPLD
ncbi:DUF4240 domain-containing protein [Peribacillus butanolivorans]|uniref:DUF4240 domain-containing protein n=1 Tax=Peribacillus butanolivorans TaxID=421767 RepID=UPI00207C1D01|nr:DUF4240 domain-containing protein [Peribacillus butanolivorans]MCO0599938.1 DUF4240 domain-containing protein [Peribacillus butanolivorans]